MPFPLILVIILLLFSNNRQCVCLKVILSELEPGQQYYYRVGDPALLAMSDEISFKMPAAELPLRISATAVVSTSFRTVRNIMHMYSMIEYLASVTPLPDIHLIIGNLRLAIVSCILMQIAIDSSAVVDSTFRLMHADAHASVGLQY